MVAIPVAAISIMVIACSGGQTDSSAQLAAPPPYRLYVFDCGTLKADPARFRLKPEEVATTNLSVPCFLVVHPRGRLIWDAGAFRIWIGRRLAVPLRTISRFQMEPNVT